MSVTAILIVLTALLWIIYDLFLYFDNKKTISQYIREWSELAMGLVFIAGFVCGHWFWPM